LGNTYGLAVVDGVPVQQSDSSTGFKADASFINPDNVADTNVLKGFAATNRYGTLGNGAVIFITTKSAVAGFLNTVADIKNKVLLSNNVYDSKLGNILENSSITKALNEQVNNELAYEKYIVERNFNEKDNSFYLDAFDFLRMRIKILRLRLYQTFGS
jgi:outer membrane receptor for ferrienterochelin and colicin